MKGAETPPSGVARLWGFVNTRNVICNCGTDRFDPKRAGSEMEIRRVAASVLILVLAACAAQQDEAAESTAVQTALECRPCRVEQTPIVRLGDVDGAGHVSEQGTVAQTNDGRYLVVSNFEPGIIKLFDSTGQYIGTTGRLGSGPGEYQSPWSIIPEAEFITIFDYAAVRATRLSANLEHLETRPMRVRSTVVAKVSDDLYVFSTPQRRGSTVSPIQVYNWSTDELISVLDSVVPINSDPQETFLTVAQGHEGTVWVAQRGTYRLDLWDARSGIRLRRIEPAAQWFAEGRQRESGIARRVPPRPSIVALAHDASDHLWVLIHDASSTWAPLDPARNLEGETYTSDAQLNLLYDTVVDVYDVTTGRMIASQRFAGRILGFVRPGIVFAYREDAEGYPYYEVSRISLEAN
jgi:hypothetical protein